MRTADTFSFILMRDRQSSFFFLGIGRDKDESFQIPTAGLYAD